MLYLYTVTEAEPPTAVQTKNSMEITALRFQNYCIEITPTESKKAALFEIQIQRIRKTCVGSWLG
jgi:hypothetical protein